MPTIPHRTIKISSPTLFYKPIQYFFWHDRSMSRSLTEITRQLSPLSPTQARSIHPPKDLSIENSWTYELNGAIISLTDPKPRVTLQPSHIRGHDMGKNLLNQPHL